MRGAASASASPLATLHSVSLFLLFTGTTAVPAARAVLPIDPEKDPFALKDPFLTLTSDELRTQWSLLANPFEEEAHETDQPLSAPHDGHYTLSTRLASIDVLRETTYVDVRLAGFNGDGEQEVRLGEEQMQRLLSAVSHDEAQHVVHPRPSAPHDLPVRRRIIYSVAKAQPALAAKVSRIVAKHAGEGGGPVPLTAVDEAVRADYLRQRAGAHVTIYLLNPKSPRRAPTAAEKAELRAAAAAKRLAGGAVAESGSGGSEDDGGPGWVHRVAYSYVDDGRVNASAVGEARCPVTRWLGGADSQHKAERYVWIDLSAGPVAYGPASLGDGVITEHALPSIVSLFRRFREPSELSEHLAVELAALSVRSSRALVTPPLWWLPDRMYTATTLVIIRIADSTPEAASESAARAAESVKAQASTSGPEGARAAAGRAGAAVAAATEAREAAVRWTALVSQLRTQVESLAAGGTQVSVEQVETSMAECRLCAAAFAAATRAHTGRVLNAGGGGGVSTFEQRHVDSELLVSWLRRFRDDLPGLHERPRVRGERVVPVFVYSSAAHRPLLLDHAHLVVPHRDLIVAVQTRPPPPTALRPSPGDMSAAAAAERTNAAVAAAPPSLPLDERCAGVARWLDAEDVTRPLLAAMLQTGWGVTPSHHGWSAAHNASVADLLWAVGRTPFGAYAERAELSFALRDAAARAPLYGIAAEVMRDVRQLKDYFREFGQELDDVISNDEYLPFLRRTNVLSYKLQRARSYLSLQSFRIARTYLLSTWHDLRAMRAILEQASNVLRSKLVCE